MNGSTGTSTITAACRMPTAEEFDMLRWTRRGRSRKQLAEWGVPWPPKRGWREALISEYRRANPVRITLEDLMLWDD